MTGWILAIDFGTTSTAAARKVGDRVELVHIHGSPRMPSMAFWRESSSDPQGGRLVLGREADELSNLAPWSLERSPKRRLGDDFMQLGDKQLRPVEIVAAILREVMDEALALTGGEPPAEVRLTHPARWGRPRIDKLRQAATLAGIENPVLVLEPVAAAAHFASERLGVGEHVAVYDLGGGTFDTAVLERTEDSFKVVGRPGGDEELGGEDFDDKLHRHLGEKLDAAAWQSLRTSSQTRDRSWAQANRDLMRRANVAKEGLSRHAEYEFYASPPIDSELSVNAEEFERLIAPELRGTVSELENTIRTANLTPGDMAAIYLAGGSSKIPLVSRIVEERLGVKPQHLDDPKAVIALGAARMDTPTVAEQPEKATIPGPPPPPPPPTPPTEPDQGGSGPTAPNTPPSPPRRPTPTTPEKKDRKPLLVGLGILAALAIGGGAAALVASGGGGGDTTTDDTTTDDTTTTTTTTTTEPTSKELTLASVAPTIHDSCESEPPGDREELANDGFVCDGPNDTTVYVESFSGIREVERTFNQWSAGLTYEDAACTPELSWNRETIWTPNQGRVERGGFLCKDAEDGEAFIQWVDAKRLNIGWVYGFSSNRAEIYRAWRQIVQ